MISDGNADNPWAWLNESACVDLPLDLFCPGANEPIDERVIAACGRCPVKRECLVDAYTSANLFLFRGGFSAYQLQRMTLDQALGRLA